MSKVIIKVFIWGVVMFCLLVYALTKDAFWAFVSIFNYLTLIFVSVDDLRINL